MNDLLKVQKKAIHKTHKTLRTQPMSLFLPLALAVFFTLINIFGTNVFRFGILGGFILAFLYALLVSGTMYFYDQLIRYNRLDKNDLGDGWKVYIRSVYSLYFLLMLVKIVFSSLGISNLLIGVLYLLLNPIPEVIYLKGYYGFDAVKYSLSFLKENALQWSLSLGAYIVINILLLGTAQTIFGIVSTNIVNQMGGLTDGISINNTIYMLRQIVSLLLTGYYMIFRGHIFIILSTSTKRKREFMGDF